VRWRAVVAGLVLVAACADLSFTPAIGRISTPIANPSFSRDLVPLIEATCASSGACHLGPNTPSGLDLRPSVAYQNIYNRPPEVPRLAAPVLIRPGFPDSSFLFRVLSTDASYRFGAPRMPLTATPLPSPVIETIRNWILQDAPNN
jgi:hypothetical protein